MNKKKLFKLVGSSCLILILASLSFAAACAKPAPAPAPAPTPTPAPAPAPAPTPTPTQPVVLKGVVIFPATNPAGFPYFELLKKVNERSKGALTIEHVGGPEAIGMFDQARAVSEGVVDMCYVFGGSYTGIVPAVETLQISLLTAQEERESGYYDFMVEQHEKSNLFYLGRGVGMGPGRAFYFWTTRRVETPYDLAGLKIGNVGMAGADFVAALGAVHMVMPWGDMFPALERGVIDGNYDSIQGPPSAGWIEAAKYFIDHSWYTSNSVFLINLDTWNSLPDHLQSLLTEFVLEVEREAPAIAAEQEATARQIMQDAGVEFIKFSPADAKWFTNLAYKAEWEENLSKHPELTTRAMELLEK